MTDQHSPDFGGRCAFTFTLHIPSPSSPFFPSPPMFSLWFPFFVDGFPCVFWFCFLRFLWVSLVCPTLSLFCVFLLVLVHVVVLPSFTVHAHSYHHFICIRVLVLWPRWKHRRGRTWVLHALHHHQGSMLKAQICLCALVPLSPRASPKTTRFIRGIGVVRGRGRGSFQPSDRCRFQIN